jgi:hypothetical protein
MLRDVQQNPTHLYYIFKGGINAALGVSAPWGFQALSTDELPVEHDRR